MTSRISGWCITPATVRFIASVRLLGYVDCLSRVPGDWYARFCGEGVIAISSPYPTTYECSGVVKNDDGSRSRGYKLATLRTLLDHAGLITQVGLAPIQVHDLPLCRLFFATAPVLRAGDVLLEDRGFVDGDTITFLKRQRHVDVIVPLKSNMLSYKEAVQLAELHDAWAPHPSRDQQ